MERRNFLKLGLGLAAVGTFAATAASAAPLSPQTLPGRTETPEPHPPVQPAVTSRDEADRLEPEQVHWRRRHWGWRRRHWRRWRRRHW